MECLLQSGTMVIASVWIHGEQDRQKSLPSLYYNHIDFLIVLDYTRQTSASGPLLLLFRIPGMCFLYMAKRWAISSSLRLYSNSPFSVRPSKAILCKLHPLPITHTSYIYLCLIFLHSASHHLPLHILSCHYLPLLLKYRFQESRDFSLIPAPSPVPLAIMCQMTQRNE